MKCKRDRGFTLVEVMVALAVVAIVATPLLQMFVRTSYVNKEAQVMDMANIIAVRQAETFKADPVSYGLGTYYYYYDEDGTFISSSDHYDIPAGAVLFVKSDLPDPDTQSNAEAYYPGFVGTIDLAQLVGDIDLSPPMVLIDLTLNITNTYEIEVEPALSPFVSDSSKMTNTFIPIGVKYREDLRSIKVTNESDKEAEFYIFNTNDDSDVSIDTIQGASSITYVRSTGTGSNSKYDLTLTVNRLREGVPVEMFTYLASVNKQI